MSATTDFKEKLAHFRREIEDAWPRLLPRATSRPERLHRAMRYSIEAGGKRLRPVLVLAAADLFPRHADPLPAAVAIECIHTYSLVHDDLPAMDNDDFRRGRPTCHKQFDEATAILAGDALLTHAFSVLGENYAPHPRLGIALVHEIAAAAGSRHLIGGQMEDMLAENRSDVSAADLDYIHRNKTGAMIAVSLVAGGLCGNAAESELALLREAGEHLGLAFQIIDDILDATATSAALGKTAGKDARSGKSTYVSLHGLDAAQAAARKHSSAAIAAFQRLGECRFLIELTSAMLDRKT